MLRTVIFNCSLPKPEADVLNQESGRVYTDTLVWHYRVYRRTGHWLSPGAEERLNDYLTGITILHAHSRDAAQQGFPKACKTARACRKSGLEVRYPHKLKRFRSTIWKNTGIRLSGGSLLLAKARGLTPVVVSLPSNLSGFPKQSFREVRLVWDRAARHYQWHLVVEDGVLPDSVPGENVVAVDLGEIHPAVATDREEAVVFSARALRSVRQYTVKRLSELQQELSHRKRGSCQSKRLVGRKSRFLAQQKRRTRDIEHKVSCAVVKFAVERKTGTIAIGDVRDIADGKRLNTKSQQKVGLWSHGQLRSYIEYKAEAAGIKTILVPEAYTSKTCPSCGHRYSPRGRVYTCPSCGLVAHRDVVGAVNILSRYRTGEVGRVLVPSSIKYRHPFLAGKRSRLDTAQVARCAS